MRNFTLDDEYWPVLAALMWIARRRKEDVDALAAEYAGPRTYRAEVNAPSGKRIATLPSGPPNLIWLAAYFAYEELQTGSPTETCSDLKAAFMKAARAGEITISAIGKNNIREELTELALQDMHLAELYGSELVLEPGHWQKLLCKRGEILKAFPNTIEQSMLTASEPAKRPKIGPTVEAAQAALQAIYPDGLPSHCTSDVMRECEDWLKDPTNKAAVKTASRRSIQKAFAMLRNAK